MIRLLNVRKEFVRGHAAVADVSLQIDAGEFVLLSGPSGSGKTTLLKVLFGQEMPTSGKAVVNGRNIQRLSGAHLAALRRELGLVFQDSRLIDRISVLENISLAAEVCGVPRGEAHGRAMSLLEMVGLDHLARALPGYLSAGERQKVSLARALANDPVLLLADEPTGNLDRKSSQEILRLLRLINREGITVLIASHDRDIPSMVGCRTLQMYGGRVAEEEPSRLTACL